MMSRNFRASMQHSGINKWKKNSWNHTNYLKNWWNHTKWKYRLQEVWWLFQNCKIVWFFKNNILLKIYYLYQIYFLNFLWDTRKLYYNFKNLLCFHDIFFIMRAHCAKFQSISVNRFITRITNNNLAKHTHFHILLNGRGTFWRNLTEKPEHVCVHNL